VIGQGQQRMLCPLSFVLTLEPFEPIEPFELTTITKEPMNMIKLNSLIKVAMVATGGAAFAG